MTAVPASTSSDSEIDAAAETIARGGLVAFPTETVYGLGARADDDAAVARIFAAKGRPAGHPLIVHVLDQAAAEAFVEEWTDVARRLAAACWPGPLTVIVQRKTVMAAAAAAQQSSIALRSPSHPVARALLRRAAALGVPGIAAPSANLFGRLSPTTAAHVRDAFGDGLQVLDGGHCAVGIESVIVDCSRGQPVLLRPGALTADDIERAAGMPLLERDAAAPRASGSLAAHYAPRARLRIMSAMMLRTALEMFGRDNDAQAGPNRAPRAAAALNLAVYSRSVAPVPGVHHRAMAASAADAAHELFAALHELDATGVALIWVEAPPESSDWDGVRDRLQRAAAA